MKKPVSKSDLVIQLDDCLETLKNFNQIYDSGQYSISKDIAVKLRMLFHSTQHSKSLISQLKLEDIPYVDTADKYDPRNLLTHHGLLMLTFHKNGDLSPQLALSNLKYTFFNNWWNLDIIISDQKKNLFTRSEIILNLANTDGGAHVDPELKESYFDISRSNSIGWKVHNRSTKVDKSINNPIPPSIRQISYETILTFQELIIS